MKINHEVVINKGREDVWKVFDDPQNIKGWQPSLKKYEHQSGQQRQVGAVSKLTYEEKGREIVITETITGRDVPSELAGRYIMPQATNKVRNTFISLDENKTKWVMICRFRFKGVAWKLISPLMREAIRKRIEKSMNQFKQLAENK